MGSRMAAWLYDERNGCPDRAEKDGEADGSPADGSASSNGRRVCRKRAIERDGLAEALEAARPEARGADVRQAARQGAHDFADEDLVGSRGRRKARRQVDGAADRPLGRIDGLAEVDADADVERH
jgi:hypothetical protein